MKGKKIGIKILAALLITGMLIPSYAATAVAAGSPDFPDPNTDPSLHIWYKLDETGGTTVTNSGRGGTGLNGTASNAAGFTAGSGGYDTASSRYITLPRDTALANVTGDFTITTRVYFRSGSTWSRLFDFGPGSSSNIIFMTADTLQVNMDNANALVPPSAVNNSSNTNRWRGVTVTRKGNVTSIYVNGALVSSGTQTSSASRTPSSGNLYISRSNWSSDPYPNMVIKDFRIYTRALEADELQAIYEEYRDPAIMIKDDYNDLNLTDSTSKDLNLPSSGAGGSKITWKSFDESVMSSDGKITGSSLEKTVILKAALSYGDLEMTKYFVVTVVPAVEYKLNDSGMENVKLNDAWLVNATQKDLDYCLWLDAERLLHWYYTVAGLTPKSESSYPNWERGPAGTTGGNAQNFRGFTLGRLMAALSQHYLSTKDDPVKNAAVLNQIKICINGLKACQDAIAASNPSIAGYVSSFPETRLNSLQTSGTNSDPLVPFWILDSMLTGICDIAKYVGDDPIGETAYTVAARFGEYLYRNRTSVWTATQRSTVLGVEYGGMNIALYMLYDLTGNPNDKFSAEQFDETSLFNPIANGQDVLSGRHANTQIPKFVGAMKRYAVMTRNPAYYAALTEKEKEELETVYLAAAKGFWEIVTKNHTYITGGNSQGEHFRNPNSQGQYYTSETTCETCNTYNMLRLTRELFKVTKDRKYADFYENTYTNAILSSQNPETGMLMYFQPMSYGFNKVFSPNDRFWCCVGTGLDSFSKLNDSLYFTDNDEVFVNLFYSSEFRYSAQNLKLSQQANMPNSDIVTVTIDSLNGNAVTVGTDVYFRVPDWCAGDPSIKINGNAVKPAIIGGYILVDDVKKGDAIELTFPMKVTLHQLPDNTRVVAYKYGPVVLSCGQGTYNMTATANNGILVLVAQRASDANGATSSITINDGTIAEWKKNISSNMMRIEDSEDGRVQFKLQGTNRDETLVYSPHYMRYAERYGLYIPLTGDVGEHVGVAQSISVSAQEITVNVGEKKDVAATVTFSDGVKEDVTNIASYTSSDTDVCTVADGIVKGVSPGIAVVTAKYSGVSGGTVSVSMLVTVSKEMSEESNGAGNPYLPLWEHLPDNEPRVFEDPDNPGEYRAYIIGSHDTRRGSYCGPDIREWSAPVDDLSNWRNEGAIFTYRPNNTGSWDTMYAPDLVEVRRFPPEVIARGRTPQDERTIVEYYLYPHSTSDNGMVCKSDRPDGPFAPVNVGANGRSLTGSIVGFDPSAWVDYIDDPTDPDYNIGFRAYVYYGYQRSYADELDQNTMWSRRPGTSRVDYFMPSSSSYGNLRDPAGTVYPCLAPGEDPRDFNFFEAASMRKVGNKYIMVFSGYSGPDYGLGNTNSALRWAYGDTPLGPFKAGGVLVDSRGPVVNQSGAGLTTGSWGHNTHGSLWEINGQWYTTYHRPPRGNGNARQAVVAPIKVEWTEPSVLDGGTVTIRAYDPYAEDETWTAKASSGAEYRGAEVTSEGFYMYGLPPYRYYSAGYVSDSQGTGTLQDTYDIWDNHMPIESVQNGYRAGYKYFGFGGLNEAKKGLQPFDGTKPGNNTKFNLWLTPRTTNAFTVQVWLDGPWANDAWKGTQIGTINVPADSAQETTQYSIDVSSYVDNLDGKHAVYLVVSGGSGVLCNLIGLGFSSDIHELERPISPALSISAGGAAQTLPALPIASTNANGIYDYFRYQVSTSRPSGDATIAASASDPGVKAIITQAPTSGAGIVRFIYNGVTKLYRLFEDFTNIAASEYGEEDAEAIIMSDGIIGNPMTIFGSGFETPQDKIGKAIQAMDAQIGSLGVDYTITHEGGDIFSLKYSRGDTSMTVQPFYINITVDTVTLEGYTGIEAVMAKTALDLNETVDVIINAVHQSGSRVNVTDSPNLAVSIRDPLIAAFTDGVLKGIALGKTFVDFMYTDSANNRLGLSVEITVGTEIQPSASAIYVNGAAIADFSPLVLSYTVALSSGPIDITLTADMPGAGLTYSVTPPASLPGSATLTVASAWGKSLTYTINFEVPPPEITSFSYDDDVFNAGDKTEFDVNVPKTLSNVVFSAANITSAYPGNVDISVALSPSTGAVSAGTPCVATVTVAWKELPELSTTYKANFGYLTIGNLTIKSSASGVYDASASVRFSDGTTGYQLIYAVYKNGRLVSNSCSLTPATAISRHQSGIVSDSFAAPADEETTKKFFLWDLNFVPLTTAFDGGSLVETEVWRVAKTIEAGKQYIVVSAREGGGALTNNSVTVPEGDGVTVSRAGRGRTVVTVEGDYITSPVLDAIPANIIWDFSVATAAHNDPGPFTGQTMFWLRNGAGNSNYLQRQSSSSTNTAILTVAAAAGTANQGIFFFAEPDETGLTSACLYSNNDSSNHWIFALLGNSSGFVAEGGNIADSEDPAPYQNAAPLRLYEKVTELRPAL